MVAVAVEALKNNAISVANRSYRSGRCCIISRSEKVGEYISEAMEKVGKDGVITIEESRGMETELEVVEGMQFDRRLPLTIHGLIMKNGCQDLENPYEAAHEKRRVTGFVP